MVMFVSRLNTAKNMKVKKKKILKEKENNREGEKVRIIYLCVCRREL